jgi:RelA/SpoT family (p)ppGpp synthetase
MRTRTSTASPHTPAADPAAQGEADTRVDEGESAGLRALLVMCATYMPPADIALIRSAFAVADMAHRGSTRVSGEAFIEHPLAVARILASIGMDASGIAAALLHDTVEDTSQTLEAIEERFGHVIATIVDGVTKFQVMARDPSESDGHHTLTARPTPAQRARQQQETVHKLLVAMIRDPRVVLLKLADRLHNMRTMAAMSPDQRANKSQETVEIYVPLAGGIGLQVFKSELEDLAFLYQQPQEYERVSHLLDREDAASSDWANRVGERVRERLRERGITAAVNWRLKRPYRTYIETRKTGMTETELHDLIAFRVLVETPIECYRAMGVIHEMWQPLNRIRDYLATPKVNGYRSLHTAVFALDDRIAQFHIRTHLMHRQVQHGVATHWLEHAARGESVAAALRLAVEDLPHWVAQLNSWKSELRLSPEKFVEALKRDVFTEQVFIFTPQGDVVDLPIGSTPLDFAYRIHSDLGDRFNYARVQSLSPQGLPESHMVDYQRPLKNGDVVTIVKADHTTARPEWLSAVRTRNAKEKVAHALRVLALARERDEPWRLDEPSAESEPEATPPPPHPSGLPAIFTLGRCCCPCPGDRIVGLPGRMHQVTVHRVCCVVLRNALARRERGGQGEDASMTLDWRALPRMHYAMALQVQGHDHQGLMHDLAIALRSLHLNVLSSSAKAIRDRNKAVVTLTCEFTPEDRPERALARLRTIPGVLSVERDWRRGCGVERA